MEDFYRRIGMPTNLRELLGREVTSEELDLMADKCSRGGTVTVGAMEVLDRKAMREVYEMAAV